MCGCDECTAAASEVSNRAIREQVGCRLAGTSTPFVQHALSTYVELIRPGHVDLMAEDCRYMAINTICARHLPQPTGLL